MSDVPATGVLLAAGQGRRAGGPKALIDVGGVPLWQVRARALQHAGLAHVVAVVHPAALPASLVNVQLVAGDPDGSPLHSLQRALAVVAGPVVVHMVDGGAPTRATVDLLQAQVLADPQALAVRPVVVLPDARVGGHPVWLTAAACDRLRALDPAAHRLDHALRDWGPRYVDVVVDDPAVLANFNRDGVQR